MSATSGFRGVFHRVVDWLSRVCDSHHFRQTRYSYLGECRER